MALELDSRYPGRFNPGDADYPQGSFKNRTAPGALDGSYLEKDWANDKEGFFQRLLLVAGISPNGDVDTALASQYYSALVQVIQANNADTINAAIATVVAAGTIDLTAGAPGTSQLEISGTGVSINGFTVAANRFFVVKMTGASNTLVNSASLVTGLGANIPVVAGDSFLMRSTAANTVEILMFVRGTVSQSKSANGYRVLHDGSVNPVIIQWGTGTTGAAGAAATNAFPITFPNNVFSLTTQSPNVTVTADTIETGSITAANFTAVGVSSGSGGLTNIQFRYIAIGN